jgi:hypothetical protein
MKWKPLVLATVLGVILSVLDSAAFAQSLLTPSASDINSSSRAALAALYSQNAAAVALAGC